MKLLGNLSFDQWVKGFYKEKSDEEKIKEVIQTKLQELRIDLQARFLKKNEAIQTAPDLSMDQRVKEILQAGEEYAEANKVLEGYANRFADLSTVVSAEDILEAGAKKAQQHQPVIQPKPVRQVNPQVSRGHR